MQVRCATADDADGPARVQVDSYRSAYAGMWPEAALDILSCGEQAQDWQNWIASNPADALYVAELSAGEIVGYALARPGPSEIPNHDGELIALNVLGPWQGQGLGRRLFAAIAKELQRRGSTSLMLWALRENHARGFYQWLHGQLLAQQKMSWADKPEVAYGWPAIEVLCREEDRAESDGQG